MISTINTTSSVTAIQWKMVRGNPVQLERWSFRKQFSAFLCFYSSVRNSIVCYAFFFAISTLCVSCNFTLAYDLFCRESHASDEIECVYLVQPQFTTDWCHRILKFIVCAFSTHCSNDDNNEEKKSRAQHTQRLERERESKREARWWTDENEQYFTIWKHKSSCDCAVISLYITSTNIA